MNTYTPEELRELAKSARGQFRPDQASSALFYAANVIESARAAVDAEMLRAANALAELSSIRSDRQEAVPDIDELAQYIRFIDGDHKLGAGAMAEKVLDWLQSRVPSPVAPQAEPVAWIDPKCMRRLQEAKTQDGINYVGLTTINKSVIRGYLPLYAAPDAEALPSHIAAPQGDGLLRQALEALDDLGDDAAAHMLPADVERCSRSECTATVYSVRVSTPAERTQPLFTREQVEAALCQYLPKDPA